MSWATLLAASLSAIIGSSFEEIAHGHLNLNMSEYGFLSGVMSNSPFFLKDIGFFILIGICGGVFGGVLTLIQKPLTLFRYVQCNISPPIQNCAPYFRSLFPEEEKPDVTAQVQAHQPTVAEAFRSDDN